MLSAPIYLLALPYFYEWSRSADAKGLLKGLVLVWATASVHHVTLIFGSVLFAVPVLWLACIDRREGRSVAALLTRAVMFAVVAGIGVGVILLPYWIAIIRHPIEQIPIPHASRSNLLLNLNYLTNYFFVPYGAMILGLPFVIWMGSANRRLRPLLFGFWIAFLFGLGGTTPVPKWIFGRAFEILTFERFTLSATLLALPVVGLLAESLLDRYRAVAAVGLSVAAVVTMTLAMGWLVWSPFHTLSGLNVNSVVEFLNRSGHDRYRYLTLGFGNALPKVSTYANANSVDGEYNSARLLPEMTHYGSAQLTSAKFFGTAGMESLRAMLKHANNYGLKYIFVHDPYYEPMLAFAGWRKIETYDAGTITVWSKEDVPPARPIQSDAMPAPWEGLLWGTLPLGSSILAILLANSSEVEKAAFVRDVAGSNGSLLTYASLEKFEVWPLHSNGREATVRVKLHYSTAVGPLDDVRDLQVEHQGETWRVRWPTTTVAKVAPQVIPVNYLRWDVINRNAEDDWGVQNVDSPQVRIISMNALQRPDRVVILGEIVNEDTIPAYINVGATLLRPDGNPMTQETSFDKISHVLLPKQVSPYRIDFPGIRLDQVKSVRMDAKAMLVPASADPVIEVNQQKLETDALGKKVLRGELVNQSGQIVNIPHVLAAYYDSNGKVIWVSDG